jgi:HAE1 family hydrophobic/amphiphilic exporter-1
VADFDTSLVVGKPEVRIEIDRKKAAELGVSVADVARRAAPDGRRLRGRKLQRPNGEQYDVFVRAEQDARGEHRGLKRSRVPSMKVGSVTLDNLVDLQRGRRAVTHRPLRPQEDGSL